MRSLVLKCATWPEIVFALLPNKVQNKFTIFPRLLAAKNLLRISLLAVALLHKHLELLEFENLLQKYIKLKLDFREE